MPVRPPERKGKSHARCKPAKVPSSNYREQGDRSKLITVTDTYCASTLITDFPKEIFQNRAAHPTAKPVALLEYMIKTYTNEGETVLDNCMGSGSTGVACVNTGRDFIGMELDPGYFKIAEERMNAALAEKNLF